MTVTSVAAFQGRWRIARRIADARAGAAWDFAGEARFTRAGPVWDYREEGVLTQAGGPALTATRAYVFEDIAHGARVRFHDGGVFHEFSWADPVADHACDPDRYRVRYAFARWPEWTAIWQVEGPRKAYTMTSRYTRS